MNAIAPALEVRQNLTTPGQFIPVAVSSSGGSAVSTGGRDSFRSHSEVPAERPSFFTRFIQGVVSIARNIWSVIREFNPFTQAFNLSERMRIRGPVQEVQNRNGLSMEDYQKSIQYIPGQNNERAVFRYFPPPSDSNKDLIILVLGNTQTFDTDCGINTLAERFHQAGHPVLVLRTGDAEQSLRYRFGSSDPSLHTEVVYAHGRNIINAARNREGLFSGMNSEHAHVIGHSFGGGTAIRYTNESGNENGLPISSVTCVDPVRLGHYHLGRAEIGIPQQSGTPLPYLHVYQDNSYFLNGESLGTHNPNVTSVHIPGSTHTTVTENQRVQDMIVDFINRTSVRD